MAFRFFCFNGQACSTDGNNVWNKNGWFGNTPDEVVDLATLDSFISNQNTAYGVTEEEMKTQYEEDIKE